MRKRILIAVTLLALASSAVAFALGRRSAPRTPLLAGSNSGSYRLVLLGDSLAAGIGAESADLALGGQLLAKLRAFRPEAVLTNLGVSGARISDVRTSQLPAVPEGAGICVLVAGANDVTNRTDPDFFATEYRSTVSGLASACQGVLVYTLPDLSRTPAVPEFIRGVARARTVTLNASVTAAAAAANVRIADVFSRSAELLAAGSPLLSGDGFHPNGDGYAKLAEIGFVAVTASSR